MPIVGARLGDQAKLAACGMAIFCAELVSGERELSYRVRNYCRIISCNAEIVIVVTVDGQIVIAKACAADSASCTCDATRLSNHVRGSNGQLHGNATQYA